MSARKEIREMDSRATFVCQYNEGVDCDFSRFRCGICGWNPNVAWKRLNAMGIFQTTEELPDTGYSTGDVVYVYQNARLQPYAFHSQKWFAAK